LKDGGAAPLPAGPYVRLSVSDNGAGIGAKDLGRIFDPYFTTKEKGTGLGLTTCYAIVSKHGGHISVDSRPGEGATFTVRLPALPRRVPDEVSDSLELIYRGTGRILAMDDDGIVAGFLSRVLHRLGYEAVLARDGEEAVRRFVEAREAGLPFSAVILDLTVVGGMGGFETVKKLHRIDPEVVAVVSSGIFP
ncbi:MAG: ATP-binding protein, partial [Elusimicrobiota bacterium]